MGVLSASAKETRWFLWLPCVRVVADSILQPKLRLPRLKYSQKLRRVGTDFSHKLAAARRQSQPESPEVTEDEAVHTRLQHRAADANTHEKGVTNKIDEQESRAHHRLM